MILLRYGYLNDMLLKPQLPLVPPILIGVGLAVALAAIFAIHPASQPVPPAPLPASPLDGCDGCLAPPANVTVAVKADKPTINPDTKIVRTIPISRLPAPTVVAPAVLPDPVPQAPPELAPHILPTMAPVHTDICQRHHGWREVHGRSWRCVYGRH